MHAYLGKFLFDLSGHTRKRSSGTSRHNNHINTTITLASQKREFTRKIMRKKKKKKEREREREKRRNTTHKKCKMKRKMMEREENRHRVKRRRIDTESAIIDNSPK